MVICELCGKEDILVFALVEGVKFRVCSSCKKFGKVIEGQVVNQVEKKVFRREEFVDVVVGDCGVLVKNFRENKGLSQHDLALVINEKESFIAKIEQGSIVPDIGFAKKLEKFLGLKLITQDKVLEVPTIDSKTSALTIGDFIKK